MTVQAFAQTQLPVILNSLVDSTCNVFKITAPKNLLSAEMIFQGRRRKLHDSKKRTYDFLLTFHSNYIRAVYCFQDIARYWQKIASFSALPLFQAPVAWGPETEVLSNFVPAFG